MMGQSFNVYCDESCHLENDKQDIMVLGAIWCAKEAAKGFSQDLHEIKQKHGFDRAFEVKWKKVASSKINLYTDFVDYFFAKDDLHFRVWIAEKQGLDHSKIPNQDHDLWYYKMYFGMLKVIFSPHDDYCVYIDIKDHWGGQKVSKLHDVICNSLYDFDRSIVRRIQIVHSYECELLQLADLLIGAVSYVNRDQSGNKGKERLVEILRNKSGYSLTARTLLREDKFNIFRWTPRDPDDV